MAACLTITNQRKCTFWSCQFDSKAAVDGSNNYCPTRSIPRALRLLLMCTRAPVAVKRSEKKCTAERGRKGAQRERCHIGAFLQEHSRPLRFWRTTVNNRRAHYHNLHMLKAASKPEGNLFRRWHQNCFCLLLLSVKSITDKVGVISIPGPFRRRQKQDHV